MRNQLFNISAVALGMALTSVLIPNITWAQSGGETLTIQNESAYAIRQIFVSAVSHGTWEEDLLGSTILPSGRGVNVTYLSPGFYDVMIVDQDRDKCVLHGVDLRSDRTWYITTDSLLSCEFRS